MGGRTHRRQHPLLGLRALHALAGQGGPGVAGQVHPAHPQAAAGRRRLEHLPRRAERDQRVRQGVLRHEAGRAQPAGTVDGRGARHDPAPGRSAALQHVQQALPRVDGCVLVEVPAHHPSGNGALPGLGVFQHLPDVELVAGDAGPALDHQPFQAHAHVPPEDKQLHELYPCGTEGMDFLAAALGALLHLAQLFPALRRHAQVAGRHRSPTAAREGTQGGGSVDGRADGRGLRRPRGHLSGDAQRADRPGSAWVTRRTHPVFQKAKQDFEDLFVDDPNDFRIAPCFSPVWDTAITRHRAGGERRGPGAPRAPQGEQLALFQGGAAARRLGQAEPVHRGERLGVRVRQRLLSRHGRHGDGADGASPDHPGESGRRPRWPSSGRWIGR